MGRSDTLAGDPVPESRAPVGSPDDELWRDLQRCIEPHLGKLVERLHDRLTCVPGIREVIRNLTVPELEALKSRQASHLRLMLSPGLDRSVLLERSRKVGRKHAMAGVEPEWYVDAAAEHRDDLLDTVLRHAPHLDPTRVQALVVDRSMTDLQGRLLGFRDVDEDRTRALVEVLDVVSSARTVADLTLGVVEALGRLRGMAVVLYVRQGPDAGLAYEVGSGPGFAEFVEAVGPGPGPAVSTLATVATGQGPMGEAWRSGEIRICSSWRTEPEMQPWSDFGKRLRWASSASIPLTDRSGTVRALLNLQSYWPGYFASAGRAAMIQQVKRVAERAVGGMDEVADLSSGVSDYAARRRHLDLLAAGRLEMVFQPIVALPTGRLSKLEALARLRDGDRLVTPAEFLPAFGDDELFRLFDLGLRQSLDALATWERRGLRTGVSVNLPVVAGEDDRYAHLVAGLLHERRIDPCRLTLELLETGVADRETVTRRRSIDELKELGVRLAQDDLGSGHSSLLRLRRFAFDDVKIDRGLISGTGHSHGSALHFIGPISSIAHSLGLTVVLEGLEDRGLIEAAVQLGVDEGQGYGIARPMPVGDVVDWAATFRLDVDLDAPHTPVGALAAHVRWEHQVSLDGPRAGLPVRGTGSCALTRHLRGHDPALQVLHESVHAAVLSGRGSAEHRNAWARLATEVSAA